MKKYCLRCGIEYIFGRRKFCSNNCLEKFEKGEALPNYSTIEFHKIHKPQGKITSGSRDRVRESVRERDKYTCQICNRKWSAGERRFDVHHLDEKHEGKSSERGIVKYDRENLERLITLCHKCHLTYYYLDRRKESFAPVDNSP